VGIRITRYKLVAVAVSALLTAIPGAFYAQYVLFIDPESVFPITLSILICLIAVLGGAGTLWGPLLGAAVLLPLSEGTRVYLGGGGRAVDLMIYGGLIVLISIFEPRGLMGLVHRLRRAG
jgi:branched-chain amino acid transport system permease protein